jgi:hypothetical protein
MKNSGTEYRTQIRIHTTIPKIYYGETTASSTNVAGKSGYPFARN